jgi:hypothetical protein
MGVRRATIAFHSGSALPEVTEGKLRTFIVSVRNKEGRVHTFCAHYLNQYPLYSEDGCGECPDDDSHADGCPETGWYYDESNFEYDHCYWRVRGEVIEWAAMPCHPDAKKELNPPLGGAKRLLNRPRPGEKPTMTDAVLTYHGSEEAKRVRVERCEAHITADRIRSGYGYGRENGQFRACAIGCQVYDIAAERGVDWRELHSQPLHRIVAEDYGWPEWLCHFEDSIFEGLPDKKKAEWPLRLVEAVPVGKDISNVRHQILAFIQRENEKLQLANSALFDGDVRAAILGAANACGEVAALHERAAAGEHISSAARSAARSAASAVHEKIADALIDFLKSA